MTNELTQGGSPHGVDGVGASGRFSTLACPPSPGQIYKGVLVCRAGQDAEEQAALRSPPLPMPAPLMPMPACDKSSARCSSATYATAAIRLF